VEGRRKGPGNYRGIPVLSVCDQLLSGILAAILSKSFNNNTRVGTLIVATIFKWFIPVVCEKYKNVYQ